MDWLYQRYWLAQIQTTSEEAAMPGDTEATEAQKAEITRLLTLYKKQQKEALRDASVPKDKEIGRTMQAIDKWILNVGMRTTNLSNSGAFTAANASDANSVGCQMLVRTMADTGFLVPTSKK